MSESYLDSLGGYIDRSQARREELYANLEAINSQSRSPVGRPTSAPSRSGGSGRGPGGPGTGHAVMPIKGAGFTAGEAGDFGARVNPVTGESGSHTGYDFSASQGTKIRAAAKGRVVSSGWDPIYGWETIIKTKNGFLTQYGHQAKSRVEAGDKVKAGQVIGRVGSTGQSTGPHLHFGVQNKKGAWIDPVKFLDRLLGRK